MEEEKNVEVEETQNNEVAEDKPQEKTYTQAEVDALIKGRFTQEEVNKMIEDRLKRVKPPTKAEIQTQDKLELERVRGEMQNLQLKMAGYEKQVAMSKYDIADEYLKYVDYEVMHKVNKNKDYATALEEFFKDEANTRFLKGKEHTSPVPRPKNSNDMENKEVQSAELRKMFGLK